MGCFIIVFQIRFHRRRLFVSGGPQVHRPVLHAAAVVPHRRRNNVHRPIAAVRLHRRHTEKVFRFRILPGYFEIQLHRKSSRGILVVSRIPSWRLHHLSVRCWAGRLVWNDVRKNIRQVRGNACALEIDSSDIFTSGFAVFRCFRTIFLRWPAEFLKYLTRRFAQVH